MKSESVRRQDGADGEETKPVTDRAFIKGLRLLETLTASDASRGITDLAAELELTKSNVHRLLQTLQALGYVRRDSRGRYNSSLKLWEIGYDVWSRSKINHAALTYAESLARQTGLLVHVTVADGDDLVFFERIGRPIAYPSRRLWPIGGRVPAWSIIPGWSTFVAFQIAFIAAQPEASSRERLRAVEASLKGTSVTFHSVVERVEFARRTGYALNLGESYSDIRGTGSAFFDDSGRPVGVLSTIGDAAGISHSQLEHWGHLTSLCARSISHELGHR